MTPLKEAFYVGSNGCTWRYVGAWWVLRYKKYNIIFRNFETRLDLLIEAASSRLEPSGALL